MDMFRELHNVITVVDSYGLVELHYNLTREIIIYAQVWSTTRDSVMIC